MSFSLRLKQSPHSTYSVTNLNELVVEVLKGGAHCALDGDGDSLLDNARGSRLEELNLRQPGPKIPRGSAHLV
jgi:hypothetical protein